MHLYDALTKRRTWKVIGDRTQPLELQGIANETMDRMLRAAGNAPFHYPASRNDRSAMLSPVPWRAHVLSRETCLDLMTYLDSTGDSTKVPDMLAAAEALVQVTWTPEGETGECLFEGNERNMEHLAAASAFTQSLLLAITQEGFRGYWSSGGRLRERAVFDLMAIAHEDLLVGSIFIFPAEPAGADVRPGKLADQRGELTAWSRQVSLKS